MSSDREFLARLDAAIGCLQCGGPLGDSPSDDFCDDECQQLWHAGRSAELVGYREPWEDIGPDRLPGIGTNAMNTGPETIDDFVGIVPNGMMAAAVRSWEANNADVLADLREMRERFLRAPMPPIDPRPIRYHESTPLYPDAAWNLADARREANVRAGRDPNHGIRGVFIDPPWTCNRCGSSTADWRPAGQPARPFVRDGLCGPCRPYAVRAAGNVANTGQYPCTAPGCARPAALGVPRCPAHATVTARPEFRLPRQTGNLTWDWIALGAAHIAARTDAQRAACDLRHEQLTERHQRVERRAAWIRPRSHGRRAEWAAMLAEARVGMAVQNPRAIVAITRP